MCVRHTGAQARAGRYNEFMTRKARTPAPAQPARWYRGADIPMRVIRRYARQVAQRFAPDKIILFGSYAYGTPHADSDVDILVIMPARNELDQEIKIRWEVPAPFPMDLLVRTPKDIQRRLEDGDLFHTKIVTQGKVLYCRSSKEAHVDCRARARGVVRP
jgi:predicted nucleotidyltransferase